MYEVGLVESVNEKRGTAKIVFDRRSACDKCKMCLAASGDKMKVYVEVKNSLGAKVGDRVGVQMSDRFVLRAAFIVYILPVILVGAGLAIFRKFSDLVLLAVVAVALLLGVIIGISVDRLIRKKSSFAPRLVSIMSDETPETQLPYDSHNKADVSPSVNTNESSDADNKKNEE